MAIAFGSDIVTAFWNQYKFAFGQSGTSHSRHSLPSKGLDMANFESFVFFPQRDSHE